MLKCKCGNHYKDNFAWEQSYDTHNEYKCRDCGEFVNEYANPIEYHKTENTVDLECSCTIEIED